jgi:phospholipid/cholesterol/gamma-HCH transport system substrate-binding protein
LSRRTEIQVGVTVLVALVILVLGVTWLKEFSLERSVRIWRVRFEQTGGLGASDEVRVNGIRKGSVRTMKLDGERVLVELALSSDVHLTRDSQVAIRNVGLMGEKVIAIDLRTSGRPYTANDTIPGIYEKGVPEVMAELGGAVSDVSRIAEQLRAMADVMEKNGDFAATLRNFKQTSEDLRLAVSENRAGLRRTLEDFGAAARTARGLTTDREAELRRSLDQFGQAAENLNRLSGRLDSLRATIQTISTRVEKGQGTLGKLVNDDQLYTDLNASIHSLKALVDDIKAHPKKYLKVGIF